MPPRARRSRGRNLNYVLEERKARRRSRLRASLIGAVALGLAIMLFLDWRAQRRAPAITANRVVVLPFDNRTGDVRFDALGLVASDWITRVLSLYAPQREVVPTTTTMAYIHSAQLRRFDLVNRSLRLARGTRAQIVVWGSFYITGDSLRFNVEIDDLKTSLMLGSVPQIAAAVDEPMRGVDRLRSAVVGAILHNESAFHPIRRGVPELHAYQAFVSGLEHYMQRRYASAAAQFAVAAERDSTQAVHDVWLADAWLRAGRYARADSAMRRLTGARAPRSLEARALRSYAQLRHDRGAAYLWTARTAALNPADDLAQYETALAALALGRPREARRLFGEMHADYGALHGRPEYYLHYAAAYHLLGSHNLELRVVRRGLRTRSRSLDVRLANCRVRATQGDEADALAALYALAARDTDTASILTIGTALEDCAGELDAHGLGAAAMEATKLAAQWRARHPTPRAAPRDSVYERAQLRLQEARALAERGALSEALNVLGEAFFDGLPYYEPGRMMLHAEPAFRRLRHTRGFLRINQTRG